MVTAYAFASEAKALLAAFGSERRPNMGLVNDFLLGAVPDADEQTFFDNVHSVLPGHLLCIDLARHTSRLHWTFRPGVEASRPDAPEVLRDLLTDAVKVRLRSDVPVGVLLSGGLDSSTIARMAAGQSRHALHCYSLKYGSARLDESHYVRLVADDAARYALHWVTPTAEHLLATIASIVWHHDGPTPLRGRLPQWHVMQEASRDVTVVLGGQGADELLGGYERFVLPFALDRLDPALCAQRSRWSLLVELWRLGQMGDGMHRELLRSLKTALGRRLNVPPGGALHGRARGDAIARSRLRHHRVLGGWNGPDAERPYRSRLNNALWNELRYAGLPELLHSEDANSMAFSLESRLPFLDHRVVEFCFSLAYSEKIGEGWTKLLLRRATSGVLPEPVRWRRDKQGFTGDYAKWLGAGPGLEAVRQLLLDPVTLRRGWIDPAWLRRRLGARPARAARWVGQHVTQVWELLTLELWCRQFLDADQTLRLSQCAYARPAVRSTVSHEAMARDVVPSLDAH